MLLIKKKPKKQPFLIADIKDEEEGIKSYSKQIKELEAQGKKKEADKIRHILRQEKQHKKILVGIEKSTTHAIILGGKLLLKKIGGAIGAKLDTGNAHWVTIKSGPLEGRHLLISGPRPADGKSKGKILAGKGIPPHVIKKITGATHAHHLDHASTRFGDVSEWTDKMYNNTIGGLKDEMKEKVAERVKWMKTTGGQGVEQGGVGRNEYGEVVSRWGRMSLNPQWYQDLHRQVGRTPTTADYKRLAIDQLENGYKDHEANQWIDADKDYIQAKKDIEDLTTLKGIKRQGKKSSVKLAAKSAYIQDGKLLLKVM